jgi:DNA-directed RNA polymerase specialized sigma24 family protein
MAEFLGVPVTTVTMRLTYARRLVIKKAKESGLL